jgi:hypothetical protein
MHIPGENDRVERSMLRLAGAVASLQRLWTCGNRRVKKGFLKLQVHFTGRSANSGL